MEGEGITDLADLVEVGADVGEGIHRGGEGREAVAGTSALRLRAIAFCSRHGRPFMHTLKKVFQVTSYTSKKQSQFAKNGVRILRSSSRART